MPFTDLSRSRGIQFKPLSKAAFFIFVGNFLILMELGAKHVESPFIEFGQICTVIYFSHFLIIVPIISLLENTLIDITSKDIIINYEGYATVISKPWWRWWYVEHDPFVKKEDVENPLNEGWDGTYVGKGKDPKPILPTYNRRLLQDDDDDDDDGDGDGDNDNIEPRRKRSNIDHSIFGTLFATRSDNSKSKISIILNPIILILLNVSIATVVLFNLYPHIKTLYPHIKTLYQHIEAIVLLLYRNTRSSTASSLYLDAPRPWGIYFQDSATPQMEGLVELHDNILFYLVIILFGVGWLLISIAKNYTNTEAPISHKYVSHGTLIELIWTITPALILILIAFPSFKLLYLMDEVSDPAMAILAEGFFMGGLKLHILNKIKDTSSTVWPSVSNGTGEKNNTLVPRLAQVQGTSFFNTRYRKQNFTTYFTRFKPVFFKKTFHTKVKASNRIGPHNEEVISVLIGSLLGDSYASAKTIEGTRFSYKQSQVHKDYLFWLYEFYYKRGYCSNLKPRMYTRKLRDKISNEIKQYYGYEFNTYTFRSFNWIHKLFYKKGIKTVSVKLEQYLTPLALAIWIMDDGGWAKPGVRISSNSFKLEEVQLLANLLKKLFYLNCTVQKTNTPGQFSIYIKGESVLKLRKWILPYVIPSMRYKLGL